MKKAVIIQNACVACGCCEKACPKSAIKIICGVYARVEPNLCVGCGLCKKICPASVIQLEEVWQEALEETK